MYEKYVKTLKENSIKVTPQRLDVLRYLDENRTHPTVDEIYVDLKSDSPSLSRTTVYNTLEMLLKHGIIQSLSITGTETRYDFEIKVHHHFLCNKCGNIIDVDIECPVMGRILESGHRVDEVHGYLKGECMECQKGRVGLNE